MDVEGRLSIEWDSPYQTKAYFEACALIGLPCSELLRGETPYYFYHHNNTYTAWELPASALAVMGTLPPGYNAYLLSEVGWYGDINWRDDAGYSTVFVTKDEFSPKDPMGFPQSYQPRFRRSLKKSYRSSLEHGVAETDYQVARALKLFESHPERREGLTFDFFAYAVWQWLLADVVDVHTAYSKDETSSEIGSAVVLKTATQTNLRYYTSERLPSNPGHFLLHSMLRYYLEEKNINIVDLSGISPPQELDPELKGITEFKLQITPKVARFAYY